MVNKDLTEAEEIEKRWQEYTELLYRKGLHDPDKHDGVITHLEPDNLECEVGLTKHYYKATGDDGIPVEVFQILQDDSVKVLHSIQQQIWKTQQCHRNRKGQFTFQSQRREMPKNVQTTVQLHSFRMLAVMLKIFQTRLQ